MARTSSRRRRGSSLRVDLSNVEVKVIAEEGEHLVKVVEVKQEEGSNAPYLAWKLEVTSKESKGAVLYNNTSLSPNSLWNLRAWLEALGVEIPDSEFELDLEEYVGLTLNVAVEKETYEGKKRPRVVDFWAADGKADEDEDEDEEEEEEKPKKGKKATSKKRARDEDEDEEDEEEEEEKPKTKKGKKAVVEDDEDEEDEKPKSKKKSKKKAGIAQSDIEDMSTEELQDVIDEHELDVDLDDYKTLRKQRAAVVDAAETAGILED